MVNVKSLASVLGDLSYSFSPMRYAIVDEELDVLAHAPDEETAQRIATALNCPYQSCK